MPIGTIESASTITAGIVNLTPPPVVFTTLVALGTTDYGNPPTTFKPAPASGNLAAVKGTVQYSAYFQNIVTDTSLSSPISNRYYITLTDCYPAANLTYLSGAGAATPVNRFFPNELKVGGWIAGVQEGLAWRIVKIFNNTTPGASNTYVTPISLVGIPTAVGRATYVNRQNFSGCITLLVEDVNFYNLTYQSPDPKTGKGTPYIYFELNQDGVPNIAADQYKLLGYVLLGLGDAYFKSIIAGVISRFTNLGAYEDNIPVIQSLTNFKVGDAIAPLTVTMTGSTIYSTLVINSFSTTGIPAGTKPIESTHIFNPSLPAGTYICEQMSPTTYRLNNAYSTLTGSTLTGTFSYVQFVNSKLSTYVSSANAIGFVNSTSSLPSFQILSTLSAYSSTIIKPFTYKAYGDYYKEIPVSTFSFSSLTGIKAGSQLAVNEKPANIPATSINDQYIVTTSAVSSITWLYLGQDTLTGADTGILNPFGGGGSGAGGGGGNLIYNDAFFTSSLTGAPPPTSTISSIISAKNIILPWVYPKQTQIGNSLVPYLSTLNANLRINISTGLPPPNATSTITIPIISGGSSSQFINQLGQSNAVTAIMLQARNATPPSTYYSTIGPPMFEKPTNVLIVANGIFSTISTVSSSPNQLSFYYDNLNPSINVTTIPFTSTFSSPGPPANFSSITSVVVNTSNVTLNFTAPTFTDLTDRTNTSGIISSILTISSLGSTSRVNVPAINGQTEVNLASTIFSSPYPAVIPLPNVSQNITSGVAPGVTYNFTAQSVNDFNLQSVRGIVSSISTFTTLPVPLPPTPAYLSTPIILQVDASRYCSTVYNLVGSTISTLLSTTTDWVSEKITTPLTPLYGTSNAPYGSALYSIAVDVNTATATTAGASAVTNNTQRGWASATAWSAPAFTDTTTTQTGITLRVSTIDSYSTAPNTYQGYYYSGVTDFTIGAAAFGQGSLVPSPSPLDVNMRQTLLVSGLEGAGPSLQYGVPGFPAAISSTSFYFNGQMGQPAIETVSTYLTTTNAFKRASGIYVTGDGTLTMAISTVVSSLGGYFSAKPILQLQSPAFSTNLVYNDFVSTVGWGTTIPVAGPIPNSNLVFSVSQPLTILSTFYTSTLLISTLVSNCMSTVVSTIPFNVLIDPQTISTLQVIPLTVPTMSTIHTPGMLTVLSTITSSSLCTPFDTGAPVVYNHAVAIGANDYEASLQITRGAFTSSTINYAYTNYANTLSNTLNYTGVSGAILPNGTTFTSVYTNSPTSRYRFAKFAWRLPSQNINGFNFTLHSMSNINPVYNQNVFQIFGLPNSSANDPPVVLNFRVDDNTVNNGAVDATSVYNRTNANGYSTPWINASVVTAALNGNTYGYSAQTAFTDEITANGFGGTNIFNLDGNNLTITVYNPQQIPSSYTNPLYVYLLVGLPTTKNITFTYASATYF